MNGAINPEEAVEIRLADWFYRNGITEVYHNRCIAALNNKNVFRVEGTVKRIPDMLVIGTNRTVYAIEIKNADRRKTVYDANKIVRYQQNHSIGATKYFIGDEELRVHAFLIATQYSEEGKLFNENVIVEPDDEPWHDLLQRTKSEPPKEYQDTKRFVRTLWSVWREHGRKPEQAGVGVLLSSKLDGDEQGTPKAFMQIYNRQWRVRWTWL